MADAKATLSALIQRRDKVRETVQRASGRLDSAKADLAAAEDECRKRKVDPAKIDDVIKTLTQRLDAEMASLETKIEAAEKKVAPYTENT